MSIEKLELVSIAGALPHLNDAIQACLESGVFHIENAAKLLGGAEEVTAGRAEQNPYAEAFKAISELDLRQIHINPAAVPKPNAFSPEEIMRETARIADSLRDVQENLTEMRKRITDDESSVIHLEHLKQADIDLGELAKCKHIAYRFGRMPEENMQKLSFYSDKSFIFQTYHTAHEYVWGFYFTPQEQILSVDAMMRGLLFERYELPEDISGTPEQALAALQTRLKDEKAAFAALEAQKKQIYQTESDLLGQMYCYMKYMNEVYRLRTQCVITHDKFNLMGYIPAADKEAFQKRIDWIPGVTSVYETPWTDSKVQPPVRLKNGWFTRPFAMFVEMYGLPDYNGYNPTTLLALTYTLLFGIMFGDLGQGIVLALLGIFLDKKKHFPLGAIMARIGFSSAVFGTLYGSVFGYEHLLDPLYEKAGISFLPLHAMENTNLIIFGAVGIGAAIILLSMLVNIVVRLKQRNYEEAIFGNNGVAGLAFFSGLLLIIIGILTDLNYPKLLVILGLIVLPLLLMFFREPLGHWMAHKAYEKPPIGDFIASNFFECFEFLLGYATNTLSFIRVGGFVFSHAGLMSVVLLLADMVGGGGSPFIVIGGNLFVMCLEGLIVGIQVLRLEFYEIFSRCYDGAGKPFTPVSVTYDDNSGLTKSESAS